MKYIGDNFEMFVIDLVSLVTNILFRSTSIGHQHLKDVTEISILLPTFKNCRQHHCSREVWFKKSLMQFYVKVPH